MSDDAHRLPPQNAKAEMSVIGSLLLDNERIGDVARILEPRDFHAPDHRCVYAAILAMADTAAPIDVVTLSDALSKTGDLERLGGADHLVTLLESVPSAANAEYYANIVRAAAVRRELIHTGGDIVRGGYDLATPVLEAVEHAERAVLALSQRQAGADDITLGGVLSDVYESIGVPQWGLRTHYDELDKLTFGLSRGDYWLLGARPSMGKTSLALCVAGHVACPKWGGGAEPAGVLFFTLEMSRRQLVQRLLCSYSGVHASNLRHGGTYLCESDREALRSAAKVLADAPMWIDDQAGSDLRRLTSSARRLAMRERLGLVVVDYLQLMRGTRSENRQQEITEISGGLKALARELDVPVLALSQLSRQTESRDGHVPRLGDLRESGSLEQDADVVLLLYREEHYRPGERVGEADVYVAKARNGPTGKVTLRWNAACTRFEEFVNQEDAR